MTRSRSTGVWGCRWLVWGASISFIVLLLLLPTWILGTGKVRAGVRTLVVLSTDTPAPPVQESTRTPAPTVSPVVTLTATPVGTNTATPRPGTTPLPTPSPPVEVSVITVRIDRKAAKPDWSLAHLSLKSVRSGTTVTLCIYYTLSHVPRSARVEASWTVALAGRAKVFHRAARVFPRHANQGLYWSHTRVTLQAQGTYVYVGRITAEGRTDAGETSITVERRRR